MSSNLSDTKFGNCADCGKELASLRKLRLCDQCWLNYDKKMLSRECQWKKIKISDFNENDKTRNEFRLFLAEDEELLLAFGENVEENEDEFIGDIEDEVDNDFASELTDWNADGEYVDQSDGYGSEVADALSVYPELYFDEKDDENENMS